MAHSSWIRRPLCLRSGARRVQDIPSRPPNPPSPPSLVSFFPCCILLGSQRPSSLRCRARILRFSKCLLAHFRLFGLHLGLFFGLGLYFGPAWPNLSQVARPCPQFRPTWPQLVPICPQLLSTWAHLRPTWLYFKAILQ